jgi:segregation and condensation protein B
LTEAKKIVEAALFMSGKPVPFSEVVKLAGGMGGVREALTQLIQEYNDRETSLHIVETSAGFQMKLRPEYHQRMTHYAASLEFSKSVLKTLAFIAYKQPIEQAKLIKYRTNKAYDDIKLLMEEGFISKEPKGRTYILRTTKRFLSYFGEGAVKLNPHPTPEEETASQDVENPVNDPAQNAEA